jgi:hypothetical protein
MQTPTIRVTIAPDGKLTLSVEDGPGPSCEDFRGALDRALGTATDRRPTSEYFALTPQEHDLLQGGKR